MARPKLSVCLAALPFVALGCVGSVPDDAITSASNACITACKSALAAGDDLTTGPCLSDSRADRSIAPGYVCDIAHNPRTPVDDEPVNQCSAYLQGVVPHFVEVDLTCGFIRAN